MTEYGRDDSDLRTIERIFTRAAIAYEVDEARPDRDFPATRHVLTTAGELGSTSTLQRTPANLGYLGFFTVMGFDEDGQLLWIGAWE